MPTRETGFALCIENRGADDLEVRKVYRVLPDKAAAATGYVRVVDDSGEDYLYPGNYFVLLELPQKAKRAGQASPSEGGRRTSRFSGPGLALLAPAAERVRSPCCPIPGCVEWQARGRTWNPKGVALRYDRAVFGLGTRTVPESAGEASEGRCHDRAASASTRRCRRASRCRCSHPRVDAASGGRCVALLSNCSSAAWVDDITHLMPLPLLTSRVL